MSSFLSSGSRTDIIYGLAEKKAIVLDLGSAYLKCGYAGEAAPRHVLRSPLGQYLRRPGGDGALTEPEWRCVLGRCLHGLYFHVLNAKPKEHRVVVCEDWLAPDAFRRALCHVLFHQLAVPTAQFLSSNEALLYTTGAVTGLTVDVGDAETRVLPIFEGHPVAWAYVTAPAGGSALRAAIRQQVAAGAGAGAGADEGDKKQEDEDKDDRGDGEDHGEQKGAGDSAATEDCRSLLDRATVEDMMVRLSLIAPTTAGSGGDVGGRAPPVAAGTVPSLSYQAVHGSAMTTTAAADEGEEEERNQRLRDVVQNILFSCSGGGGGEGGGGGLMLGAEDTVTGAILEALRRTPRDLRAALVRNIVVGGGTAAMEGFLPRLAEDIGGAADVLGAAAAAATAAADTEGRGQGNQSDDEKTANSNSCDSWAALLGPLVGLARPLATAEVRGGAARLFCGAAGGGTSGGGGGGGVSA